MILDITQTESPSGAPLWEWHLYDDGDDEFEDRMVASGKSESLVGCIAQSGLEIEAGVSVIDDLEEKLRSSGLLEVCLSWQGKK